MDRYHITVDGCDYRVEMGRREDVLWVYEAEGQQIASAEKDHGAGQVFFRYVTADEGVVGEGSSSYLFYNKTPLEIAKWLVATHPVHG